MTTDIQRIVQQFPGFREAVGAAREETLRHRADLIAKVREHRDAGERAGSQLAASASELQKKAAALREQLAAVELDLSNNTAAWNSARTSAETSIRQLHTKLRADVVQQVNEIQQTIAYTRECLHNGFDSARTTVLGSKGQANDHVVAALAILLAAYREVELMAVDDADVETAIANLRARLVRDGIRLIAPGLSVH